ncbi:putative ubiquitin carboxyl-terminal hydrolase FAF [Folsomia candida]|uniref:Ubiquitin carboxyl-terminal hydrolase n=1 Tax=Folsomia candida TaxID=158441 RepID=A0A226DIE5_FOLCA|nr:putative ubiquitin carboxyl-terminal hydrolase FAF [Folsomia candida]
MCSGVVPHPLGARGCDEVEKLISIDLRSSLRDFVSIYLKILQKPRKNPQKPTKTRKNPNPQKPGVANPDWEYAPLVVNTLPGRTVANRPPDSFVGLKNGGATCYMNSVLQQLFMVDNIKRDLLAVELDGAVSMGDSGTAEEERKTYNVCILKQLQNIFGHLALSKLQYHVPTGLWRHFRLQGRLVNPREEQDAVEFFTSLVESVDDGLKAQGEEQIMSKHLGGLFSDQKICKECPHRYAKEEPFSILSVEVRSHSNLANSLEQYVKGELLEGADAYHCERCNKKVATVKRLCVKRLPPVLAIQLKRFEYDYEQGSPVKFNDYFEFPRKLNMEPYTVAGLAKIEGELVDAEENPGGAPLTTKYRLTGVVVHSGQATGGHYYSYISYRYRNGLWRWYKFDDSNVTECQMDLGELKKQFFGGNELGLGIDLDQSKSRLPITYMNWCTFCAFSIGGKLSGRSERSGWLEGWSVRVELGDEGEKGDLWLVGTRRGGNVGGVCERGGCE